MKKICTKCLAEKPIEDFYRDRDKIRGRCKKCECAIKKEKHAQNREEENRRKRQNYLNNKDEINAQRKVYRAKNKNRIKAEKKRSYLKNRDKILEKNKRKQPEATKREVERYKSDTHYRIKKNLRINLAHAISRNQKGGVAIERLGCSIDFLVEHFKSIFQYGMSWENYREWQIDHIVPLDWFDLEDESQVKVVCHWTNLQPLWPWQNAAKGNDLTWIE
jgi:hypothetical protein